MRIPFTWNYFARISINCAYIMNYAAIPLTILKKIIALRVYSILIEAHLACKLKLENAKRNVVHIKFHIQESTVSCFHGKLRSYNRINLSYVTQELRK